MKQTVKTDWTELNRRAFEKTLIPAALPQRDHIPFWNANARQFLCPPAFEAAKIPGAEKYRFELKDDAGKLLGSFESDDPQSPLSPVWAEIPVGYVNLTILPVDKTGKVGKEIFHRRFYRCDWFHGPYPFKKHDYRKGAEKVFSYIYHLDHVQNWLHGGTVDDKVYRKYCYPSKTLPAIITALRHYMTFDPAPEVREKVTRIAAEMADWLIDNSNPAGSPLEYLPPTYWKYASYHLAVQFIGQNMLIYPMNAGLAYLDVFELTGDAGYLQAARRLADSMKRLQLPNGSWYLKLYEKDGKPVDPNIVVLNRNMFRFLSRLAETTGDGSYLVMRDRAMERIWKHNLPQWDWDGQFEDVQPKARYQNLTKDGALFAVDELIRKGETETVLRIIDWSEDQFVMWGPPPPDRQFAADGNWRVPAGLEQYNCYLPIDASTAQFVFAFCKAYQLTQDQLYLEKAKVLADNLIFNQAPDGSIQTWLFNQVPEAYATWLNCMNFSAEALLFLDETLKR